MASMGDYNKTSPSLELPLHIWDQIISKLGHDHDPNLEPLSLVSKAFLSITNHHKQTLKISKSTAKFLPALFYRFPNLKHISFSEFPDDPTPILTQIADFGFRLETLDLSHHEYLPMAGFEKLPAPVRNGLKSFKMRSNPSFRRRHLEDVACFFPNLEELDLGNPKTKDHDDDYVLGGVGFRRPYRYDDSFSRREKRPSTNHGKGGGLSELKCLRRVDFEGTDHYGMYDRVMSDDVLALLSTNCPDLEEIVVNGCHGVTLDGVAFALQACKNLKSIALDSRNLRNESFDDYATPQHLHWPPTLSKISLSGIEETDDVLCCMVEADLPLKSLALSCCSSFTDSGVSSFLQHYDSLEFLSLESTGRGSISFDALSDASIIVFAKYLTNLRGVKLNHFGELSDSALFVLIKHCPLLESVEMKDTKIGKEGSFRAKNVVSHSIRSLNLSNNGNLSEETLTKIVVACPDLEMLRLSSCDKVSSTGVGEIMRNCGGLKQLRIRGCKRVTSLDLDSKSGRHKLELLVASGTSLKDKALVDIARNCPNLMFLDLRSCERVTSRGVLEVVEKCTKLKEMNLSDCKNMGSYMVSWIVDNRPLLMLSGGRKHMY